jgi:hypothetical protein
MKDRLLVATLAGVGFLATLGISTVHEDLWQRAAAPVPGPLSRTRLQVDAVMEPEPAAPEPQATDPAPGQEVTDSGSAPTYEEQTAARDRAAAHGARSR